MYSSLEKLKSLPNNNLFVGSAEYFVIGIKATSGENINVLLSDHLNFPAIDGENLINSISVHLSTKESGAIFRSKAIVKVVSLSTLPVGSKDVISSLFPVPQETRIMIASINNIFFMFQLFSLYNLLKPEYNFNGLVPNDQKWNSGTDYTIGIFFIWYLIMKV